MIYNPDLSPDKKLDVVLQYLVNVSVSENLTHDLISKNIHADGYEKEIFEILLKLLKDGYVFSPHNGGHGVYYSNFDGRLFIDNGGYTQDKSDRETNETIVAQNERRIKRNDRLLVNGTWFAGLAAAVLFLWQLFLYFYPVHKDYPYWFWEKVPIEKHV